MAQDTIVLQHSYKYIGSVEKTVTRQDYEGWSYTDTERTDLYLDLDTGLVVGDIELHDSTLTIEKI